MTLYRQPLRDLVKIPLELSQVWNINRLLSRGSNKLKLIWDKTFKRRNIKDLWLPNTTILIKKHIKLKKWLNINQWEGVKVRKFLRNILWCHRDQKRWVEIILTNLSIIIFRGIIPWCFKTLINMNKESQRNLIVL